MFEQRYQEDKSPRVTVEVKVVDRNGQGEKTLVKGTEEEVLGHYWATSDQIGVVSPSGIEKMDLNGKAVSRLNLTLPAQIEPAPIPPNVDVSPENFVVIGDNRHLQIVQNNGESTIIADPQGRDIENFSLSPNKQQIAYTTFYGPVEELWAVEISGKNQHKLYELPKGGKITTPRWSPDGKSLVIGHRPTGTYYTGDYELTLINLADGQIVDLHVDRVEDDFVWGNDGKWLYYARSFLVELPETFDAAIYRLRIQQ